MTASGPSHPLPTDPITVDPGGSAGGLGETRPRRVPADQPASRRANRRWWDHDADAYHLEHGEFLGEADLVWCPENLREEDVHLLGDVRGRRILEVGCGSAPCARWLVRQGARVVAFDLSAGMLRHARETGDRIAVQVPLVQADACELPFADRSFDAVFSAFGAVPFVADSALLMREVARVLRPGGRWVFSVTHPMRWIFLDDPGPAGLTAVQSYFDRSPYVEVDQDGVPAYVEHHRTLGDRVREITAAGLRLVDVVEPMWPEGFDGVWGQWSAERGEIFPGTAIFVTELPG
ncbi:methyltransferase domain-containing protein [Nakamurella flavida]|uniref:Methyltransferase domain-containing protein n=1 Tax=Nakamurella flavida TaxID=363630 RepID=A0A939C4R0_9ACTN|nr:class I SAM-dependent methyltransferase [Nakamurella flavida]MBM9475472.1 methyltransferase domain-containing protein [Nakamurella flavida]MDP9777020.1 SAM-dependent methyltransferase [Nakamurella flavida]